MARVLVVDDEAIITMQRAERISAMGHKVVGMASLHAPRGIVTINTAYPHYHIQTNLTKCNGIPQMREINWYLFSGEPAYDNERESSNAPLQCAGRFAQDIRIGESHTPSTHSW